MGRWADQDTHAYLQQVAYQQPPAVAYPQPAPAAAEVEAPATAAQPPADDDVTTKLDQFKQLGELREQGILTDEEFAAEKAKILGH